ncbi:MAG: hypothetical protein HOP30_21615 [Cyclobacteriaceae bacterium]|nr:hypothetical protein [Cyclobacteriaceae bacterium]
MKKNYPGMAILDETDKYFIGHIYEDAYLIDKRIGEELVHDDFYGDPTCGVISKNNEWAIIAGEHLTIWRNGKTVRMNNEDLRWIHAIRTLDQQTVEMLINPWAPNAAIWILEVATLQFKKLRDFQDYQEKEYTEEIVW